MTTFNEFLCGATTLDYKMQDTPYEEQVENAALALRDAGFVLLGAGAGMSTAAGARYGGQFFQENFGEFQQRYGSGMYMQDMYSAGFYPYPDEESMWGYWSKQALIGGADLDVTPLHRELLKALEGKRLFCLTTNADAQFEKAGLPTEQIFATQGDYAHIQCAKGCHPKVYDAIPLFRKMDAARANCMVPSELVPKCPECGGPMAINLRSDSYFVEDEAWHAAEARFGSFLDEALASGRKLCLLELGVGFNTPTIIRFPFERLAALHSGVTLVRLNLNEALVPADLGTRAIGINADIAQSLRSIIASMQNAQQASKR